MELELLKYVAPLGIAGLVWAIRLEGRINVNEAITKELRDDIAYIRQRIDQALNGRQ